MLSKEQIIKNIKDRLNKGKPKLPKPQTIPSNRYPGNITWTKANILEENLIKEVAEAIHNKNIEQLEKIINNPLYRKNIDLNTIQFLENQLSEIKSKRIYSIKRKFRSKGQITAKGKKKRKIKKTEKKRKERK